MEITKIEKSSLGKNAYKNGCEIHFLHVKIKDFKGVVNEFKDSICNTTWIKALDELSQITFEVNVEKTINHIIQDIISKISTSVTEDIGEYLVSYGAQNALEIEHFHKRIPLAELLKEKIAGNPGFDFHTISTDSHLIFGEAKFSLKGTPKGKAINQIALFINDRDKGELPWLKPFLDEKTSKNIANGNRGYAAAFSLNEDNLIKVFQQILKLKGTKEIIKHKELYLIAIEIC